MIPHQGDTFEVQIKEASSLSWLDQKNSQFWLASDLDTGFNLKEYLF